MRKNKLGRLPTEIGMMAQMTYMEEGVVLVAGRDDMGWHHHYDLI